MNSILIAHLLVGPTLLLIGFLAKMFPPKKINSFYGYRTPRSMRSNEAWKEANTYSTNALIILAVAVSFIQLVTHFIVGGRMSLSISAGVLVVGLIVLMILTERHLKSKGFN